MAFPFYTQPKKENRSGTDKKKFRKVQIKTSVLAKDKITEVKPKTIVPDQSKKNTASANGLNVSIENNDAWEPKYRQFKNKPKEAIKHLLKVKKGDCLNALYRKDIGFIDIVWGENDAKNKGFGLKHIVEKHGKEIEQLGFKIEDFLPIIVQFGDFKKSQQKSGRIILEGSMFRVIIKQNSDKNFLLTAFDLRPMWKKEKSSGLNGTYDGINFAKKPLLSSTFDLKKGFEKSKETNKITDGVRFTKPPLYSKTSTSKKPLKTVKTPQVAKALPAVGRLKPVFKNKDNKNNIEKPNSGLNSPKPSELNKNSLAYKMANQPKNVDYFNIPDKNISRFLGKIEKKTKESVFISLTGGQGSMKTRMAFQLMNVFAQNYKVGHVSIEEHPESVLYFDKAKQYLNAKAQNNISNPEIENLSSLHKLITENDVIIIDSFTKLKEIEKSFEVDKDLRKKYDGKLFIVIFQQTTDGSMRGGSKSQFDADIVLFTEKFDDYTKNYIYADKNRYSRESGLKFNIYKKQLVQSESESPAVQSKIKKLSFNVN